MATYTSLISTTATATAAFLPNNRRCKPCIPRRSSSISCNAAKNNNNNNNNNTSININDDEKTKLDRRNVLIGLGGLYGSTTLHPKPLASAAPIPAPDFTECMPADMIPVPGGPTVECCPPVSTVIKNFTPDRSIPLRTRPAAHLVTEDYLAKFKTAQALMRALPEDDPRSFAQQAKVHCAYCNGAYPEAGFPDIIKIQVHFSWIFFPFHRMYLYFYERILGKLIEDPTFALPYWNWDAPAGFQIPAIYDDFYSPLYDSKRNANHRPPALLDLGYALRGDTNADEQTIKSENLAIMHRSMVSGAKNPSLFFGGEHRAGDTNAEQSPGSIENQPHTNIHMWAGTTTGFGEDMGNFYSAGLDPLFYAHHANVDRMWTIWKTLGGKRNDITDPDWLDTEFLFYDENAELVRCKVRDSLEPASDLRYSYEQVTIPWLFTKPTAKKETRADKMAAATQLMTNKFPATLDKIITVEVARPKPKKRTQTEKNDQEEVLVIKDIEFNSSEAVKFDVHINDDAESLSGKDKSEFAGSFVSVPHLMKGDPTMKANLKLAITDLLADLGVEDDTSVLVTLVPRCSNSPVTIGGFKIEFSS